MKPPATVRSTHACTLLSAIFVFALMTSCEHPSSTGSDAPPALGSGGNSTSALLSAATFESCSASFPEFSDHAINYIGNINTGGVSHSGQCSAGIGLNGVTYGKLLTDPFPATSDLWLNGWVYFSPDFSLPQQNVMYNGHACSMGVHFWRLSDSVPATKVAVDLNVPTALDNLQLLLFQLDGHGSVVREFVKWTSFQPASNSLRGGWQYWQLHVGLGTAGNADGFLRFYANGVLIDSLENQPFLPAGADASWAFTKADLQSNVSDGGDSSCDGAWPASNGWFVDDVRICKTSDCK